jgi:hypothetical protein
MDISVFHWFASLFSVQVVFRNSVPVDEILTLRTKGYSLADIAKITGSTVSIVRRVLGC